MSQYLLLGFLLRENWRRTHFSQVFETAMFPTIWARLNMIDKSEAKCPLTKTRESNYKCL